jgi:predicted permease
VIWRVLILACVLFAVWSCVPALIFGTGLSSQHGESILTRVIIILAIACALSAIAVWVTLRRKPK